MQKWEYCAVAGISASSEKLYAITPGLWEFTPAGARQTALLHDPDEVARTIARLGLEGWEMVGTGGTNEGYRHILYFKRPLP